MSADDTATMTAWLHAWASGDEAAGQKVLRRVYDQLRSLARQHLAKERCDHTLQPTELVHEAFLRMVDAREVRYQDRQHFFALASLAMRRILVDHARSRQRQKRGGQAVTVCLDEANEPTAISAPDVLAVDDALNRLAELDPQQARFVELRFFGGLSLQEAGTVLGWSRPTASRRWRVVRAWLYQQLSAEPSP